MIARSEQNRSLIDTGEQPDHVMLAIELWLLDRYALTQSKYTATIYRDILYSLRMYLQERTLDLDQPVVAIALHIQAWASLRTAKNKQQGNVAPATYNQRLAAVSSFYQWAIESGMYTESNPTEQLKREPVRRYVSSRTLNPQTVSMKLKAIDRSGPQGLRDYVLLQVALNTGRSAQELAALTWGCVYLKDGSVTLTFQRCKSGKVMYDTLDPRLSKTLLQYLHTIYGSELERLHQHAPIWVSFSDRNYHQAIGPQTIADISKNRLGVSTVSTLRHTFALVMDQQGAAVSTIQERLGHASAFDTSVYLTRLKKAHNPHAAALADVFGVG